MTKNINELINNAKINKLHIEILYLFLIVLMYILYDGYIKNWCTYPQILDKYTIYYIFN